MPKLSAGVSQVEWNQCIFRDCMNEENGLPTLEDKSIDLAYTDPPWGVNYGKGEIYKSGKKIKKDKNIVDYNDKWNPEFHLAYFNELYRICEKIIIVVGQWHLDFWYNVDPKPKGMLIIHTKNHVSRDSKIATWNHFTPYLYWGKFKKKLYKNVLEVLIDWDQYKNTLIGNVIEYVIPWGFLSKEKYIHPSPKGTEIALKIMKKLEIESIIDPFAGSGSYLKAASILGIKWLGYELNPIYKQDIDKRFAQKAMEEWM